MDITLHSFTLDNEFLAQVKTDAWIQNATIQYM